MRCCVCGDGPRAAWLSGAPLGGGRDLREQLTKSGCSLVDGEKESSTGFNLKVAQIGFFLDQVWGGIKYVPEGFVLSSWKME